MKVPICSPFPGSVVMQDSWQAGTNKPRKGYPALVYIVDGVYEVDGRLSNWWTWRKILPNGRLSRKVSGYGAFYVADHVYITHITVIQKK
jgi:hypothetical protein